MSQLPSRYYEKTLHDPDTGCTEWVGGKTTAGYGMFWLEGKLHYAHRIAYEHFVGPIPKGLHIDHLCRVRHCVNPAHLEPVTQRENNLRGVSPSAINAAKTHCSKGHEYSKKNTHITRDGYRMCRECNRVKSRESYRKKIHAKSNR